MDRMSRGLGSSGGRADSKQPRGLAGPMADKVATCITNAVSGGEESITLGIFGELLQLGGKIRVGRGWGKHGSHVAALNLRWMNFAYIPADLSPGVDFTEEILRGPEKRHNQSALSPAARGNRWSSIRCNDDEALY